MSCVLRASGEDFLVDEFIRQSSLIPCHIYRKGQPKSEKGQKNGKVFSTSGLTINVSDADFSDLPGQIQEATAFLQKNKVAIKKLCQYDGVDDVRLDFGISQREEAVFQYEYFPPTLIILAGRLGLGIEISIYPKADDLKKRTSQK